MFGRVDGVPWIHAIVGPPFLIVEFVTCLQIHAPDMYLPRQVLVDQEVLTAHPNTNPRTPIELRLIPVEAILEVVFAPLFTQWYVADLHWAIFFLFNSWVGLDRPARYHTAVRVARAANQATSVEVDLGVQHIIGAIEDEIKSLGLDSLFARSLKECKVCLELLELRRVEEPELSLAIAFRHRSHWAVLVDLLHAHPLVDLL